MCILCHKTSSIDPYQKYTIRCPNLVEVNGINLDCINFVECEKLTTIKNVHAFYSMNVESCPELNLIDAEVNDLSISDCPKLERIRLSKMMSYVSIDRCPNLIEFPPNNVVRMLSISSYWIYCVDLNYSKYRDVYEHIHGKKCYPHYNKIVSIQRAIRKRKMRKIREIVCTLETGIVSDLWSIILEYCATF